MELETGRAGSSTFYNRRNNVADQRKVKEKKLKAGSKTAGPPIEFLRNSSRISATTPPSLLMKMLEQYQMEMVFIINVIEQ